MLRLALAALGALLAVSRPAHADPNDLVLSRLGIVLGDNADAMGDSLAFRSLVSELGVVMAPRLSAPADTLGFGGFQVTADVAVTSIAGDAAYWRAREGSPDPTGSAGMSHGGGTMSTAGVFIRKGLWLPLPSFEVAIGAVHLMDSNLHAAQGYAKLALLEGYDKLPLPSIAVRGGVSRLMGSSELDLTVVSVDGSISKAVGILGTVSLEPFVGWNLLIMIPRSEVVDKSPQISGDRQLNFVFKDQDDVLRTRYFGGFKLKYYLFALTFEAMFAGAGTSVDDRVGTDDDCAQVGMSTTACDSTDQAGAQQTYTVTLGLDF